MATIPAYSKVLWDQAPGSSLVPPIAGPIVPGGTVWVVREIIAENVQTSGGGGNCPQLRIGVGPLDIWETPPNRTVIARPYYATDVRYVMAAGESFTAASADFHWSWRISGYQLSA